MTDPIDDLEGGLTTRPGMTADEYRELIAALVDQARADQAAAEQLEEERSDVEDRKEADPTTP